MAVARVLVMEMWLGRRTVGVSLLLGMAATAAGALLPTHGSAPRALGMLRRGALAGAASAGKAMATEKKNSVAGATLPDAHTSAGPPLLGRALPRPVGAVTKTPALAGAAGRRSVVAGAEAGKT